MAIGKNWVLHSDEDDIITNNSNNNYYYRFFRLFWQHHILGIFESENKNS
jgi:hypothetical protein